MPAWSAGVQSGTRGAQPTPASDAAGVLYFVSDEDVLERWSGSAWVQVAVNQGGTPSGTAFPGSPVSGDMYYRTNVRGGMLFRYDGTRWLSEQEFFHNYSAENVGNGTVGRYALPRDYAAWLERYDIVCYCGATANGSNYKQLRLLTDVADTTSTTIATWSLATFTQNQWGGASGNIGAATALTAMVLKLDVIDGAGSPGAIYPKVLVYYRLIAT